MSIFKQITLNDMVLQYILDDNTKQIGLRLIPKNTNDDITNIKPESLIQAHILGDIYPNAYANGKTMRQSQTSRELKFYDFKEYSCDDTSKVFETILKHDKYGFFHHKIKWFGDENIYSYTEYHNTTHKPVILQYISSFSLCGIDGNLTLHRLQSAWSMEARLLSQNLYDINLEQSWANFGVRCERFGQVGSMPTNGYFPWAFLEDTNNNIFYGCQLKHNASWQIEVYRENKTVSLSGGLADFDFGHWQKEILPNETFITPQAILTTSKDISLLGASERLISAMKKYKHNEKDLPIIFNEYCTTWGKPSQQNIESILKVLKNKPISYFVIDAGWYKPENKLWDNALGDWNISKELFPNGLEYTVKQIQDAGMIAGIWFEPENVGHESEAFNYTDHLLKRDNTPITTFTRRFFDFRDKWVHNYLKEKVIDFLKKYNFGYVKLDYNDTIGVGCDGAESLGEGLRQHLSGVTKFIENLKQNIPDLIIENCSSGGHRLEPSWLSLTDMSSFSDAHECVAIPIIAANLHYAVLPSQSQIWAVLRKNDSINRIVYSMCATFLGRMCISGDVTELSNEQWQYVDKAMSFYKKVSHIIKNGHSERYGNKILSYNNPIGWQCIKRDFENESLIVIHQFNGQLSPICIDVTDYKIKDIYCSDNDLVNLQNNQLVFYPKEQMSSVAIYLQKNFPVSSIKNI